MTAFTPLYKWYNKHKRDLPWRHTKDPYLIWLSEVILQQTRVDQGLPYYLEFSQTFTSITQLAKAPEKKIMKMWQGLGYYSRAANMHHTAKLILSHYKGKFPSDYNSLIQLKGIGPYTAAAVSSFAANEAHAVVDGNVYRVLSRLFEIEEPINSQHGKKLFSDIAANILDKTDPALHNQAMMELGAMVCKPKKPDCLECPLRLQCRAYKSGRQSQLPVKMQKKKAISRFLNFIVVDTGKLTLLQKRTGKGIWQNLYEPPCIETKEIISNSLAPESVELLDVFKNINNLSLKRTYECKHQLTHQNILAVFWVANCKTSDIKDNKHYVKSSWQNINQFAVHRLFDKFLKYYTLHHAP